MTGQAGGQAHPEREVMGLMLTTNADMVAGVLRGSEEPDSDALMRAIAATRSLAMVVDDTLRALVAQARAGGHTWAEIGDVLHVTRQAAFQRFGGGPEAIDASEALWPLAGAGARAISILEAFLDERWKEVRADFDERMSNACSVAMLLTVRRTLAGELGAFADMGTPTVALNRGYTVTDVPLAFERGDRTGRVALDADGRVAGFFVLPPEAS